MTNTVISRVAIQARIGEWRRQFRGTDHNPVDFHFAKAAAERVAWFRRA